MGKFGGVMTQQGSGLAVETYTGFSWPCLFFGCFWYLVKGMIGWAIAAFFISLVTFGVAWFVFPFLANRQYREHLAAKGYALPPR